MGISREYGTLPARSLGPLEKPRAFGMTPRFKLHRYRKRVASFPARS